MNIDKDENAMFKLFREIQEKRKIRKLFRLYGKSVYQARVDYVSSFLSESEKGERHAFSRFRLRTLLVVILLFVLLMTVVLVGAKTLDVPLPAFSFIEKEDHSEVTINPESDDVEKDAFLEIGYVPKGYSYVGTEFITDVSCETVYINDAEEYLYIDQYQSKETTMGIDHEKCTRHTKLISGVDVEIFSYEDGRKIYLFAKNRIYVVIQGYLSEAEMERIINNLI